MLGASGGIEIQGFGGLSHRVNVFTATDDFTGRAMLSCGVPEHLTDVCVAPVRIGLHAVAASGSTILPGCDLGEGAVLGAQSLATRFLKPWTTYLGPPAVRIADRSRGCKATAESWVAGRGRALKLILESALQS